MRWTPRPRLVREALRLNMGMADTGTETGADSEGEGRERVVGGVPPKRGAYSISSTSLMARELSTTSPAHERPRPPARRSRLSTAADEAANWSTAHLLAHLELVRAQVEAVVAARRQVDPKPDDPYRGVYTDEREIDSLLAHGGSVARRPPPNPAIDAARAALAKKAAVLRQSETRLRLDDMAEEFGLDGFDVDLLLVGLAPDLDPSFEKLYGYLNDDVTRRRASVGLAIELCGAAITDGGASRLASPAPLIAGGLASVEDTDRPVLGRSLRVPDRVVDHLLGRDEPDPLVAPLIVLPGEWPGTEDAMVERAVRSGITLFYAQERAGSAALSYFARA